MCKLPNTNQVKIISLDNEEEKYIDDNGNIINKDDIETVEEKFIDENNDINIKQVSRIK